MTMILCNQNKNIKFTKTDSTTLIIKSNIIKKKIKFKSEIIESNYSHIGNLVLQRL